MVLVFSTISAKERFFGKNAKSDKWSFDLEICVSTDDESLLMFN